MVVPYEIAQQVLLDRARWWEEVIIGCQSFTSACHFYKLKTYLTERYTQSGQFITYWKLPVTITTQPANENSAAHAAHTATNIVTGVTSYCLDNTKLHSVSKNSSILECE